MKGRHADGLLPVQPQRDPGRGQQPEPGGDGQHPGQQRCLVEQVLEVVHDEQQLSVAQRLGQIGLGGLRRRRGQAQGPGYHRRQERWVIDGAQVDEGHTVGEITGQIAGRLQRQPGLPGSPDTGERDEPGGRHGRRHLGALSLPADQRGRRGRKRRRRQPGPRRGVLQERGPRARPGPGRRTAAQAGVRAGGSAGGKAGVVAGGKAGVVAGGQVGQRWRGPGSGRDGVPRHLHQVEQLVHVRPADQRPPAGQRDGNADDVRRGQHRVVAAVELVAEHVGVQPYRPGELLLSTPDGAAALPYLLPELAQIRHPRIQPRLVSRQ